MENEYSGKRLLMPAEWQPHKATHLAWPHNNQTWPGTRLKQIQQFYLTLIALILRYEELFLLIPGKIVQQRIDRYLAQKSSSKHDITYIIEPYNDVWIRDYGPMYVKTGQQNLAVIDWEYNAWGDKYSLYEADNKIAKKMGQLLGLKTYQPRLVLEGGAVEINGCGSLLTTRSVLFDSDRNTNVTVAEWEHAFSKYLGIDNIFWLDGGGIRGDDTGGHIDNIARFVSSNRIVITRAAKSERRRYSTLEKNYSQLRQHQSSFDIIALPLPEVYSEEPTVDGNNHLPASYANFYILNGAVIVPVFNEPEDEEALAIVESAFPERSIQPLYSRDLIWGQGGIHCITQQVPLCYNDGA